MSFEQPDDGRLPADRIPRDRRPQYRELLGRAPEDVAYEAVVEEFHERLDERMAELDADHRYTTRVTWVSDAVPMVDLRTEYVDGVILSAAIDAGFTILGVSIVPPGGKQPPEPNQASDDFPSWAVKPAKPIQAITFAMPYEKHAGLETLQIGAVGEAEPDPDTSDE